MIRVALLFPFSIDSPEKKLYCLNHCFNYLNHNTLISYTFHDTFISCCRVGSVTWRFVTRDDTVTRRRRRECGNVNQV